MLVSRSVEPCPAAVQDADRKLLVQYPDEAFKLSKVAFHTLQVTLWQRSCTTGRHAGQPQPRTLF